jgi:hypothetical protein
MLKNWTPVVLLRPSGADCCPLPHFNFSPEHPSFTRAKNVSGGGEAHDAVMFVHRPDAGREQKMEVVSRLLIRKFKCKLTGGFIRDWVINGDSARPHGVPVERWIALDRFGGWEMTHDGVVPKDLDVELELDAHFDVVMFVSLVRDCGISVDFYEHKPQRHCFVFDRLVGPFTVDIVGNFLSVEVSSKSSHVSLAEPHFVALHTL